MQIVSKAFAALQIDFHVGLSLLFRVWSVVAGFGTVLLVALLLGPDQQGYYYTFSAIVALQVFFELGLSQVVAQLVAHEAAHLTINARGGVSGDARRQARLASLMKLIRRWFNVAAGGFIIIVAPAGTLFFNSQDGLPASEWLPPWLMLVTATAATLRLSPRLAVNEGFGHVGQVARLRLIQGVVGSVLLWLLLLVGAGLWAVCAIPMTSAIATGVWLRGRNEFNAAGTNGEKGFSYRTEILPMQWRIAVSWLSGYFIFNLFTPVTFARHGAVEAGRIGLALSVFNAISAIGMSWVAAKSPGFGMAIARGQRSNLIASFRASVWRSTALALCGCVGFIVVAFIAGHLHLAIADRIASLGALTAIGIATTANVLIFGCASYMRAHKEEPMLVQSVVTAALVGIVVLLVKQTELMLVGYATVVTLVGLPWTLRLTRGYLARDYSVAATHHAVQRRGGRQ